MAKGFDSTILTKMFLSTAEETFGRISKVAPSDPPTAKLQHLIEYQGRMSVTAMEKFNGPTYISGVSFYLSSQDKDKHRAVGAMALYIEASNAEKLLKAFGYSVGDDEEDEEVLNACGKVCVVLAEGLKKELAKLKYPDLILSVPVSEKNSLADGIESGANQMEKQEISFFFWKKKVLVVDLVLSSLTAR
jgi:hypothetical protein